MNTLLLCSQSLSRLTLLQESGIPFQKISNDADESSCCWKQSLEQVVMDIATHKMACARIPSDYTKATAYIVTADTLGATPEGVLLGKPSNREQARTYIRKNRGMLTCATAFCVEKRERVNQRWYTVKQHRECVTAQLYFYVSDDALEAYIDHTQALHASGGICIEGYGAQFVRSIHGSYSAICGLPLYQLRMALLEMGFFTDTMQ